MQRYMSQRNLSLRNLSPRNLSPLIGGMLLLLSILPWAPGVQAQSTPNYPFPQHVDYAPGTLHPTNFSQAQQDQHVRAFYEYWKNRYLITAGRDSNNQPRYRISLGSSDPAATVSEGQGYGMVIVALMAGYDSEAQAIFDGLWRFSRTYPSGIDRRLMSWKIRNGRIVDGNTSAFDGDADIAYGLLLADAQWGSNGAINYRAEAQTVIAGILASTIGPNSRLPMLGDWVDANGTDFSQFTPRSSDFMPAHFQAYGRATGQSVWNTVISRSQAAADAIQRNYSADTGLLPDFLVDCDPAANCAPANDGFLEGANDGAYYYNAGRDPWRIGLHALLNDDAAARATVRKMVRWLATATNGNVNNIRAGYQLDGTPIGNYFTSFFVAPFGVAAMVDPTQQAFLNAIYGAVYNRHEDYYEDSVNLLVLLVMTGNYWDPTNLETPPPPPANDQLYYLSSDRNGRIGALRYSDEDILQYATATGTWTLVFDGSDVGLSKTDIDGFQLLDDGSILMSVDRTMQMVVDGSTATVRDADILRFVPTQLGETTAGAFEFFFQGANVELTSGAEDIDALTLAGDGTLLISTMGTLRAGSLRLGDEDVVAVDRATNRLDLFFDGSALALTAGSEDITSLWLAADQLYFTTKGAVNATASNGTIQSKAGDLLLCELRGTGLATACALHLVWSASDYGWRGAIDGLSISDSSIFTLIDAGAVPTASPVNALPATGTVADALTEFDLADPELDAYDQPLDEDETDLFPIYLPFVTSTTVE